MKSQTKRTTTATKQVATKKAAPLKKQAAQVSNGETFTQIPLGKISFSPLNYRKYFDPKALEDFARELQTHGIISPITVRPSGEDKFELVAGERRVRAARLTGLRSIAAVVKTLSDEEVNEVQLAENIQRENPHPLHEAQAITKMLDAGKTIDEAALRLGKSKTFVYSRMKLAALIAPLQIMFLANKLTIQGAFDIAKLPAGAQQELFDKYCEDWDDENFELRNLGNILHHFNYDLLRAPFNIKDKKLLPEAGACTNCPFNSATLKMLFPEAAKQAVCNNKSCYGAKCTAHLHRQIKTAFSEGKPDALITYNGSLSEEHKEALGQMPEAQGLPCYGHYDVSIYRAPKEPQKEDYTYSQDEEEPGGLDESGYNSALQEYEEERQRYGEKVNGGGLQKGLYLGGNLETLWFSTEKSSGTDFAQRPTVTAKEVQEAIKAGKATPELLQAEIDRLNAREARARELDGEKLQLKVHGQFATFCEDAKNLKGITRADMAAARLLVFQNLNHSIRRQVSDFLFSTEMKGASDSNPFEMLANITETQFSYLIRMAIVGRAESKSPRDIIGYGLYKMAEEAGMDVGAIEKEQAEKVSERGEKLALRIKELEKKIEKLNKVLLPAKAG